MSPAHRHSNCFGMIEMLITLIWSAIITYMYPNITLYAAAERRTLVNFYPSWGEGEMREARPEASRSAVAGSGTWASSAFLAPANEAQPGFPHLERCPAGGREEAKAPEQCIEFVKQSPPLSLAKKKKKIPSQSWTWALLALYARLPHVWCMNSARAGPFPALGCIFCAQHLASHRADRSSIHVDGIINEWIEH